MNRSVVGLVYINNHDGSVSIREIQSENNELFQQTIGKIIKKGENNWCVICPMFCLTRNAKTFAGAKRIFSKFWCSKYDKKSNVISHL